MLKAIFITVLGFGVITTAQHAQADENPSRISYSAKKQGKVQYTTKNENTMQYQDDMSDAYMTIENIEPAAGEMDQHSPSTTSNVIGKNRLPRKN